VGPVTALSYRVAIDVPERFARSRDVGVHLGLTPRGFRSGTINRQGRISCCGDEGARTTLFLAAQCVLRSRTHSTTLKEWGLRVASKQGYLKAVIAVARRLAVILHRMWTDGTDFRQEVVP
jgi:transposase